MLEQPAVITVHVIGATSGEMVGRWDLPISVVARDLKDQVLTACDESVVMVELLYGVERVTDAARLASFPATGEGIVFSCIKQDAVAALNEAMIAMDAVFDRVGKKHISEVKAYASPPELLMKTCVAFMMTMFPQKVNSWANFKMELGDTTNVLHQIKTFDKTSVSSATLRKLDAFCIAYPELMPENVMNVSVFGGCLCQWIRLVNLYALVVSGQPHSDARAELDRFYRFAATVRQERAPPCEMVAEMVPVPKLERKLTQVTVEQFKVSCDFEALQAYVALQEKLPFVACDDLSGTAAREALQQWSSLTERLADMVFQDSPDLRFPVPMLEVARQILQKEATGTGAQSFLQNVDSFMTKIASTIEFAVKDNFSRGLDGFMSALADDIAGLAAVWSSWRDSCKLQRRFTGDLNASVGDIMQLRQTAKDMLIDRYADPGFAIHGSDA